MRIFIIAGLIVAHSFASCQPSADKPSLPTADAVFTAVKIPQKSDGVASNIVFQLSDGGKTWKDVSAGLPTAFRTRRSFVLNGEIFMNAGERGLYRGNTATTMPVWKRTQYSQYSLMGEYVYDVFPLRCGPIICNENRFFFQEIAGSGVWRTTFPALKGKVVHSMCESKNALFASWGKGIFKSTDGGTTWQQVYSEDEIHQLTESNGALIAVGQKGVVISIDEGAHWEKSLPTQYFVIKVARIEGGLVAIEDINVHKNQVHISKDNGKTWNVVEKAMLPFDTALDYVRIGDIHACSHKDGISVSTDGGKTWKLMHEITEPGEQFVFVTANGIIYAVLTGGC
jgi:photosystem II stability/assembly factor-like uncharacterized protein